MNHTINIKLEIIIVSNKKNLFFGKLLSINSLELTAHESRQLIKSISFDMY
jgi:hypothetical protein